MQVRRSLHAPWLLSTAVAFLLAAPSFPQGRTGSSQPVLAGMPVAAFVDPQEEEEAVEEPSAEALAKALATLEEALDEREPPALVAACVATGPVPHAQVTRGLEKVLKLKLPEEARPEVWRAALAALGEQRLPQSLAVLAKASKRKDLRSNEAVATALLRAIAEHEHPRAIELLAKDATSTPGQDPLRARILGLARVRTDEALEAVLDLMNRSTTGRGRNGGRVLQMEDFRLALAVLTGQDHGNDATAWMRWHNDVRRKFHVAEEAPALPKDLDRRWRKYWGLAKPEERGERREDRGGDDG